MTGTRADLSLRPRNSASPEHMRFHLTGRMLTQRSDSCDWSRLSLYIEIQVTIHQASQNHTYEYHHRCFKTREMCDQQSQQDPYQSIARALRYTNAVRPYDECQCAQRSTQSNMEMITALMMRRMLMLSGIGTVCITNDVDTDSIYYNSIARESNSHMLLSVTWIDGDLCNLN